MLLNTMNSLNTSIKKLIDIHKPPPIMKEFTMTFSSDPLNGALNVSSAPNNAGSSFQVVLNQPLSIPKDAKSAELAVTTFYGWWTILNVVYQFNDTFQFQILSGANAGTYTVEVPAGIYSLNTLASAINIQLLNEYPSLPANPLTFTADQSTQRVIIVFNIANCQVDFAIPYTMRDLLGYTGATSALEVLPQVNQDIIPDPALFPSGSFVNQAVYANNVANFNTINYLLVNSPELGRNGLPTNGNQYNTLCIAPITVPVGSQIVDQFVLPQPIDISYMIGNKITNLSFALTDQDNRQVNTNGEAWSIVCSFRYYL